MVGGNPEKSLSLGLLHANAGNTERAREILAQSTPVGDDVNRARWLKITGDEGAALEILERLFDSRSRGLLWFNTGPQNDIFRDDPRFEDLIRRMSSVPAGQ
ncbi:MAG TPA: hypothetical protein EYQ14_20185 [Gammaproteobacteria bacterium]|nr:hypothetical protein [Gammaproteobacteria bacterium]HIL99160.1 hypothetical protein [Pseudomonadales bacterium]